MPRLNHRYLPFQSWKTRIVAIECYPLAAPLDRERCEPGIGDARSSRVGFNAQASEDVPVPFAGLYNLTVRLPEEVSAEPERLLDRARRPESARVGGNPNYGAQCHRR